jgi:hypothetical protein
MRRDFQIAILLALAAIPAGVALMAAPYYAEEALKAFAPQCFWGGLGLTVFLIIFAFVIAIRGEAAEPRIGHKRRMIALTGMVVCGIGFGGFAAAYFWPSEKLPEGTAAVAGRKVPTATEGDELKVHEANLAKSLRQLGSNFSRTESEALTNWSLRSSNETDPDVRRQLFQAATRERQQRFQQFAANYTENFRLIVLKMETDLKDFLATQGIIPILPTDFSTVRLGESSLRNGMLSGVDPVGAIADYLDFLANKIHQSAAGANQ